MKGAEVKTLEQIRESIKKIQVIPTKRHDRIKEVLFDLCDYFESLPRLPNDGEESKTEESEIRIEFSPADIANILEGSITDSKESEDN